MSINRWNMRAVISTVDIEKSPSGMYVKYEDYAEELSALKAQRDELLARLKESTGQLDAMSVSPSHAVSWVNPNSDATDIQVAKNRAAIANAEARPCD